MPGSRRSAGCTPRSRLRPRRWPYVDVFWLPAAFSALMFLCSFLLKANKPGGGNVSMH